MGCARSSPQKGGSNTLVDEHTVRSDAGASVARVADAAEANAGVTPSSAAVVRAHSRKISTRTFNKQLRRSVGFGTGGSMHARERSEQLALEQHDIHLEAFRDEMWRSNSTVASEETLTVA